jgi:hypothetical protein
MAKSLQLDTFLNPQGVERLKRKLIEGEITAKTFKTVIKLQILKQNNIIPISGKLNKVNPFFRKISENLTRIPYRFILRSTLIKKFKSFINIAKLIYFKPTH